MGLASELLTLESVVVVAVGTLEFLLCDFLSWGLIVYDNKAAWALELNRAGSAPRYLLRELFDRWLFSVC